MKWVQSDRDACRSRSAVTKVTQPVWGQGTAEWRGRCGRQVQGQAWEANKDMEEVDLLYLHQADAGRAGRAALQMQLLLQWWGGLKWEDI